MFVESDLISPEAQRSASPIRHEPTRQSAAAALQLAAKGGEDPVPPLRHAKKNSKIQAGGPSARFGVTPEDLINAESAAASRLAQESKAT